MSALNTTLLKPLCEEMGYDHQNLFYSELAYFGDIFSYINEMNLKLQGRDKRKFNVWDKVESF
ncbi:hypothetical protein PR048_005294 [Dryococelus australis]|uniref:Uncharacterized protein n=1 Tax=Dryococelus australis TaxID=614101 RepID=A0ABQ9I7U2_9NEOP|nr:hypothetical protein PR048_005294 [Dryococelus australis]